MTLLPAVKTESPTPRADRSARISQEIAELLGDLSGLDLAADQYGASFLELGFDSLFLTQAAQKIQNKYGVKVAFRQLLDTLGSIRLVAEYLDQQLPQDAAPVVPAAQVEKTAEVAPVVGAPDFGCFHATGDRNLKGGAGKYGRRRQDRHADAATIAGCHAIDTVPVTNPWKCIRKCRAGGASGDTGTVRYSQRWRQVAQALPVAATDSS